MNGLSSATQSKTSVIPNISVSQIDTILNELTTTGTPELSNCSRESLSCSRGSPISPVISNSNYNLADAKLEFLKLSIIQKSERTVFAIVTFPTITMIKSVFGETSDSTIAYIEHNVASAYGMTDGHNFDESTKFLPGDYCLGIIFRTKEEADKVIGIKIQVNAEPISNLMLAQMIFGLYRCLGFEPSHTLKYPVKSVNPGTPFYRKTRSEINEMRESLEKSFQKYNTEKGGQENYIAINELEKILEERNTYLQKLREAEDHIDYLQEQIDAQQ